VAVFGLFVVGLVTLMGAAASGQEGGDTLLDNLWLGIPGVVAGASALASLVLGAIAVIKSRERSVATLVAVVISAIVAFFLVGEFTVPH
jgi:hypothetical protein